METLETEQDNEERAEKPPPKFLSTPDGGYGWVVIFASFMCNFVADGLAFSFGVIYPEFLDAFGSGKFATSWISSLFVGIPLISGPIAGLFVNKYGCRSATIFGGLVTSFGIFLSTFAASVEMLSITYGVIAGFGLAFIYVPASVMPSFWFEKKRSLATGMAAAGSGLGTFVMAPLTEHLIQEYGWRGTLLITSGITLNFVIFGALFREAPSFSVPDLVLGPLEHLSGLSLDNDSSLASCQSFTSLHIVEALESKGHDEVTEDAVLDDPMRKHHSTNTIYTGEEFELLQIVKPRLLRQRTSGHLPVNELLRSRHSLLPVSRHDITAVVSLALRRSTMVSCPELTVIPAYRRSTDGDDDEATEDESPTRSNPKKGKAHRCLRKARNLAVELCDIRLLAVPVYLMFFISNFTLSYAYDVPYLYLPDYAARLDIDNPSFLIAIIGIVNTFGQVLFGYLGDKKSIDTLLLYGISILVCGIFVAVIPLVRSYAGLASLCALFGLLISANFSLETIVLVKILSLDRLTKAYGLLMFGQGIASLIGPPIAGLLWDVTKRYEYTFLFAGISIVISGILAIAITCVRKKSRSRSVSESTDIASLQKLDYAQQA